MSNVTLENYRKVQRDIAQLREKLNEIHKNKEECFNKKERLKKEINELIRKIKEIKAEKDQKNIELQTLKEQRDKHNDAVHTLLNKIKSLNNEKSKVFKKYNIKMDPTKIQEKINELEKRVEIEVNFEKEKKLMEEIKKLKKEYGESTEVIQIAKKANELEKEVREVKKRADEFHRKIQEITKDTNYEVFMELSNRITSLRKEQEEAFQKFIVHKTEFSRVNHELKNLFEEFQVLRLVFSKDREAKKIDQQERENKIIDEKIKKVEEKLKTKKRITTEDLIALQGFTE